MCGEDKKSQWQLHVESTHLKMTEVQRFRMEVRLARIILKQYFETDLP